jgi:hypothetical protein
VKEEVQWKKEMEVGKETIMNYGSQVISFFSAGENLPISEFFVRSTICSRFRQSFISTRDNGNDYENLILTNNVFHTLNWNHLVKICVLRVFFYFFRS